MTTELVPTNDAEALAAARAETEKYRAALYRQIADNAVLTELTELPYANAALLLPALRSTLRVVEENDELSVQVLTFDGHPKVGDSQGNPITVRQYIRELRGDPRYSAAFNDPDALPSPESSGKPTIRADDQRAFMANLAEIASGKMLVTSSAPKQPNVTAKPKAGTIAANDEAAFLANMAEIAKGKVKVAANG